LNVRRGIITTLFAKVLPGVSEAQIAQAFQLYSENPLIRVSSLEASGLYALSLKQVVGSARAHIRYKLDGNKLYVFSLIDNLMKGAASQAIENFNRLTSQPHFEGLLSLEGTL
jgi:N-acetyl-gamma-glutamyl-phosphate reductase